MVVVGLFEHIGDIVACEPVIPYLREKYPDAVIGWLVDSRFRELLDYHPEIDEVLPVANLRANQLFAASEISAHFFDLNVHLKRLHPFLPRYRKLSGELSVTNENYLHFGGLLEAFSRGAGLPTLSGQPRLYLPEAARATAAQIGDRGPYCVVHPGANSVQRQWPREAWETAVRSLLAETESSVIEVGAQSLLRVDHPRFQSWSGRLSLTESAAVIEGANLYLGTDSGPSHIANTFCVPSVILLGPLGQFHSYFPYSGFLKAHQDRMILRHASSLSEITPDEVVRRAVRILANENETVALGTVSRP